MLLRTSDRNQIFGFIFEYQTVASSPDQTAVALRTSRDANFREITVLKLPQVALRDANSIPFVVQENRPRRRPENWELLWEKQAGFPCPLAWFSVVASTVLLFY